MTFRMWKGGTEHKMVDIVVTKPDENNISPVLVSILYHWFIF